MLLYDYVIILQIIIIDHYYDVYAIKRLLL